MGRSLDVLIFGLSGRVDGLAEQLGRLALNCRIVRADSPPARRHHYWAGGVILAECENDIDDGLRAFARFSDQALPVLVVGPAGLAPRDTVDMQDVLVSGTAALGGMADERGVTLVVSGTDEALPVIGNRDELIQVVENLISNAIKYCRKDGTVRVTYGAAADTVEARAKSGQVWENGERMTLLQSVNRPGPGEPAVWIRVEDEGPGIERQHLPRLGERFYRTDQSRGGKITGTGLGLAIVKHIMAHHRGGMAVETVMEQGSAFAVWLPAMRRKAEDA